MIACSSDLDQQTLLRLQDGDPVVLRYRALFATLDWSVIPEPVLDPSRPGRRPHPESAYVKALLVKVCEHLDSCTQLRNVLLEHPLLVRELGFRLKPAPEAPFGFDVEQSVPCDRWLRHKQQTIDPDILHALLVQTVHALQAAIAGLGETVAVDVKHLYAWVQENNPRAYVKERHNPQRQPRGDPDCRLGVKRSTNQQQADGSTKEIKEYLWGYGSGIVTAILPSYGDLILAEYTQPFNENDITYYHPLYDQVVTTLGFHPHCVTADAAFDDWDVYQTCAQHGGIAAIPLNAHGHPLPDREADGTPRCARGLRMFASSQFNHTNGYRAQRFRCPLLYPEPTGQTCEHEQFLKEKGCVKDINIELGGLQRVLLDRTSPTYKTIYRQRTSAERINSQAKSWGIERPKVRNGRSVAHLNTLTYIVINAKALQRAHAVNVVYRRC
jgi:hypothetical protein